MHNVIHLQSFRSVVVTGSVRSAAQSLGLSPSAISHHLKTLEHDTGLTLFHRQGRGLSLTETGNSLLPEVNTVLEASSLLDQKIGELRENRTNRLSIGYFGTAGNRWLPELVSFLENKYPRTAVQLNLAENPWPEMTSDIQMIISSTPEPVYPTRVNADFIVDDPYVVAVPNDHELARRTTVSLSDIEGFHWIDNDADDGVCRSILLDACSRAGVPVRFKHEAHSYSTALHMVGRGLGLTVLPLLGIDPLPEGVTILRLAPNEPTRYIYALSDPGHPEQALIEDAIRALRELAREDLPSSPVTGP